ncbi:MAG: sulfotransferase [Sphingobium sp.]
MKRVKQPRQEFRDIIDDALGLLQTHVPQPPQTNLLPDHRLSSLLERCQHMVDQTSRRGPAAIRTVHHLACTGGTLLSRAITAMPNVRLLSEVDPLSQLTKNVSFAPSDVVQQSRLAARPVAQEAEVGIFLAGLDVVYKDSSRNGLDLVIRDHSHSMFHFGPAVPDRRTLREIVRDLVPLRSVVTVRHPIDSFLSLREMNWDRHFSPNTLEEYCLRYGAFLDRHDDLQIIRYEDFLSEPEAVMRQLCDILDLAYIDTFAYTFQAIHLSGNSGRGGETLRAHPRRAISEAVSLEMSDSRAYAQLCDRLGYDP